ncbi:MAG: oxidoreductase, partial [Candidatus Colwellbacteria bacterium]|nr:oxidoreductase [Candidatus Colwellbacteria bacterium]
MKDYLILESEAEKDYELIDSGDGMKLERYGQVILSRPDPQAVWPKMMAEGEWKKAAASFGASAGGEKGQWKTYSGIPVSWPIEFGGLSLNIRLS